MDLEAIPPPANVMSDQAYLNSMSLLLGKIINMAFGSPAIEYGWLDRLKSVQEWRTALPDTFEPFSRASDQSVPQALPTIRMLGHHHSKPILNSDHQGTNTYPAAAIHYYLVSLSILVQWLGHGQENLAIFQKETGTKELNVQDILERHALDICGSAVTSNAPTVLVNAFGPISYCKASLLKRFYPLADWMVR